MSTGEKRRGLLLGGVLLVAFAFLLLGVLDNEHIRTMDKAIRICLECIGVG